MRKAIKIGQVTIEDPVILAPMSGVSDLPFRRLVKKEGAGLVVSEMIASQAMIRANRKTLKMASNCAEEFPMAVQLAGCEPSVMAEAAKLNEDRGAAIIDINMGCDTARCRAAIQYRWLRTRNYTGSKKIFSSITSKIPSSRCIN